MDNDPGPSGLFEKFCCTLNGIWSVERLPLQIGFQAVVTGCRSDREGDVGRVPSSWIGNGEIAVNSA